nr:MAG TPA: hypothetical protein [Caudoviricetes sp.]DAU28893.1 MAG TPA: hypothetical protein [Caudoviricetes sp.]
MGLILSLTFHLEELSGNGLTWTGRELVVLWMASSEGIGWQQSGGWILPAVRSMPPKQVKS